MIYYLFLFVHIVAIDASHFNGGSLRWTPVDDVYENLTSVTITISQSYWWTYPLISCANNVPISTSGRSTENSNLTCVVDCSTDGGYSMNPVNILTDCTSVSSSLGMMTSQRSVNITLTADAHFYLSYTGSAWVALNNPAQSGLQWSITSFIDLRMRPDGIINTPPTANVVSPQYVFVNTTAEIPISVSDANAGDDVRCRWSTYTPGYRRRKRSDKEEYTNQESAAQIHKKLSQNIEIIFIREKRHGPGCAGCLVQCYLDCLCTCSACSGTTCSGTRCLHLTSCLSASTTVDTPGTLMPTSSYPHQQAIDECGSICYPSSVPNGTTLSNCTLSFKGLVANTWYGIAIQVNICKSKINKLTPFSLTISNSGH
jgi:hypothetical protein